MKGTALKDIESELDRFRGRLLAAVLFVLFAFGLLAARLVWLQVIRHDELATQAEQNRIAVLPIVPNRGLIVDRNGIVLANNYSAYTLEITPSKAGPLDAVIEELGKVVPIDSGDRRRFRRLLDEGKSFDSIPIRNRLSDEEVARFMAQRFRFPGRGRAMRALVSPVPTGRGGQPPAGLHRPYQRSPRRRLMDDWSEEDLGNYKGTDVHRQAGPGAALRAANCTAATGFEEVETRPPTGARCGACQSHPADAGPQAGAVDRHPAAGTGGARCSASAAARSWRSTRAAGELLAFVSKPTFDPNLFVDGIDAEQLARAQREHRQAAAQPRTERHLPARIDLQALHGDGRVDQRQAQPAAPSMHDGGTFQFGNHTSSAVMATAGWAPVDMTPQRSSSRATSTTTRWPTRWAST